MNSTWGNNIRLSVFGESHGRGIGVVIDGLKAGVRLDFDKIKIHSARRAPGKNKYSTPRLEADEFELLSGFFEGRTTGAPLCCFIGNTNTKSEDYGKMKSLMRPGHSDYPAYVKYNGFNDIRGGGHFSGRLTAPLVIAGSICRQYLKEVYGIDIYAHILQIKNVCDIPFDTVKPADYSSLYEKEFCTLDDSIAEEMKQVIEAARLDGNSVGGVVEGLVTGLPAGVGNPIFHSVESILSSLLFSIPAVKAVEFGEGCGVALMTGEECNDCYCYEGEKVQCLTNNNGGITGGITNGMPISFKATFKPTPTISKPQQTVDVTAKSESVIAADGRHDPCIVPRAVVVAESVAAIGLLEAIGGCSK